jgi:hypothetical protein
MTEATQSDNLRHELSPAQERALPLVLAGRTDREVADVVGVGRQTIWRWRNEIPVFVAALNRERHELWASNSDRLRSLTSKALAVVDEALDASDVQTALAVLRLLSRNLPDTKPQGPISVPDIERERALSAAWADFIREMEDGILR